MKGKGNGLDAIKMLALKHGEKVVMVLVVALAGWLLYSTFSHETLPENQSAERLKTKATTVSDTVSRFTWGQAVQEAPEEVRQWEQIKSANAVEVSSQPYFDPTAPGFDRRVVQPIELRKNPKLLPVADFQGSGMTGLFAFVDEDAAKERILRERREELERERDAELERERMQAEGGEGRGPTGVGGRGGRNPRGGFGGGEFGMGAGGLDMEGLRPVPFPVPRAGVDLQGDELIRQLSCAVVVAKVPLPEQLTEYKKALGNTRSYQPDRDYPQYKGYLVERAEVTESGELNWQQVRFPNGHYRVENDNTRYMPAVSTEAIGKIAYNWASGMEDVYDTRYGFDSLTMPLAPLVGRNWDEMAYHSDVPTAMETEAKMMDDQGQPGGETTPTTEEPNSDNLDIFGGGGTEAGGMGGEFGGRGGIGGEFGGRGGRGGIGARTGGMGNIGARTGGMGGMGGIGARTGGRGGEMGMGRGGMGGGMGAMNSAMNFDEKGELIVEVPFLMLRFFDMTVQPGKSYKYRVQLVLADPNYMMPKDALDPSAMEKEHKTIVMGEWSDASPTISIPQAGRVRVANAETMRDSAYAEPEANMLIESFDIDEKRNARQAAQELEKVRRGSVMNYHGDVEMLVDQGRFIKKIEDFTIDTGVVLLDIDGGEAFTREMNEPTHALLMDATGRMYLRDELDDELEVAIHRAIFAEPDRRGPGGMDGGRGNPRGGGGEFGGGFGF